MLRGIYRVLWTAGFVLLASGALAQAPPLPDGNKEAAKEWANRAKERFDLGDYKGAIDGIVEAEKHARPPTFTRLKAQAYEKLGKLIVAEQLYRSIAGLQLDATSPPAWLHAQAEAAKELAALTPRIPLLEVAITDDSLADGEVTIDGARLDFRQLGRLTPQDPGKHVILVKRPNGAVEAREITLAEGAKERVVFAPKPARPKGPEPMPLPLPTADPGPLVPPFVKYLAFGLGGAGLVAGGVTGGLVLSEMAKAREMACRAGTNLCTEGSREGFDSLRPIADASVASFIAGGVLVATGVVLVLLPSKKASTVGWALSPSGLTVQGTF